MRLSLSCPLRPWLRALAPMLAALALPACTSLEEPEGPARKETLVVLTADHQLLRVNAGQPRRVLDRRPVGGLPPGETLLGIDYRVARGVLYALGRSGAIYTLDEATGKATRVGTSPLALPLPAGRFGFDFNPAADRLRVVSGAFNLRIHPDTGAAVDADPQREGVQGDGSLAYEAADPNASRRPDIVAAAYTYNNRDDRLTTNYAIDGALGILAMQGSREGAMPVVSPNTGRLTTVGALGTGPLDDASFDIADIDNAAFAALRGRGEGRTRLYAVDLSSGRAQLIGTLDAGRPILGLAVKP